MNLPTAVSPIEVGYPSETWPPSRDNGCVGFWLESIRGDWTLYLAEGYIVADVSHLPAPGEEDLPAREVTFVAHIRLMGESTGLIFPNTKEGDNEAKRVAETLLLEKIDLGLTIPLDTWVQTYSDECWDLDTPPEFFPMRLKIYHDFDQDYYRDNPESFGNEGESGFHYVKCVQINGWKVKSFPITPLGISEVKEFAKAQFRAVLEQAREEYTLLYPFPDKPFQIDTP